jgi:hypothetical protein
MFFRNIGSCLRNYTVEIHDFDTQHREKFTSYKLHYSLEQTVTPYESETALFNIVTTEMVHQQGHSINCNLQLKCIIFGPYSE